MKKLLIVLVAVLLAVSMLPSAVFAANEEAAKVQPFPELVITEVHLNSINVEAAAGPFAAQWNNLDWWKNSGTHPASNNGLSGDFMRYIEVYNSSDANVNLYDYTLVVDSDPSKAGTAINKIDLATGVVAATHLNPKEAVLAPGDTAVIYLYNANDKALGCTPENFVGYYEWRNNSNLATAGDGATKVTPTYSSTSYVLDMGENPIVVAIDDTATNSIFADYNTVNYYGLVKDSAAEKATDDKNGWTSWVYWTTMQFTTETHLLAPDEESTQDFVYGFDSTTDIREGRRFTVGYQTTNTSPCMLTSIQTQNLKRDAKLAISEINNTAGTTAIGIFGDRIEVSNDNFAYIEVVNISNEPINIYDYCVTARWNISQHTSGFPKVRTYISDEYFDRVSYLIPGDVGDLQCYTSKTDDGEYKKIASAIDKGIAAINPDYADGVLQPGETALLWEYMPAAYTGGYTIDDFKTNYCIPTDEEGVLVIAMSGVANQKGELSMAMGISNSKCCAFGIAPLSNFDRETPTEMGADKFAEIKKEPIVHGYTGAQHSATKTGYNITSAECVAYMFEGYVKGVVNESALGTNVAYQFNVNAARNYGLGFVGYLETAVQNTDGNGIKSPTNVYVKGDNPSPWLCSPATVMVEQGGDGVSHIKPPQSDVTTPPTSDVTTPTVGDVTTPTVGDVTTPTVSDVTTPDAGADVTTPNAGGDQTTAKPDAPKGGACGGIAIAAQLAALICAAAAAIIIKKK